MSPDNVTVLIGQTVQIMCKAVGTDIDYQWMKDGVVVSKSRRLRLTNIQESDEGPYMCRASNNGGMVVSNPGIVTVYGELAVNVNYIELSNCITITITCPLILLYLTILKEYYSIICIEN